MRYFHRTVLRLLLVAFCMLLSSFTIDPRQVQQCWDGWGVSLCWWAGQCGKWDDDKIDEIVSWLVSPDELNFSHFRYNIGGGDDPLNRHCAPHHMAWGKGLRAEMEGFKDSTSDRYHWERDAAQRKIMLKIRELRPDAVFEAFSNSCPFYMTVSGCVGGNAEGIKDNLKPEYYEEFAHYLVDVCKHYKDVYGLEFKTLEPFNESATDYWYQGGSQEGCHFDYPSQIAFLRVLSPVLRGSGLRTVISASDETSVGHSIGAFEAYRQAGVLDLVGQWNTHTYGGNNRERDRLAELVGGTGKPFWMSETGSGGKGLAGNLRMAQRLIDDVRHLKPEAWLDWQYMEEHGDQWSLINGSFRRGNYQKVKNFYVRQQVSRFIRRGYNIVASDSPSSLAAVSPEGDTLVVVLLNEGGADRQEVDLSLCGKRPRRRRMEAFRTSPTENMQSVSRGISRKADKLLVELPAQSITTLVIPIELSR